MIAERSQQVPGYDKTKVERLILESLQVEDVDSVFPLDEKGQPAIQAPPPPDFQLKTMEEQRKNLEAQQKAKKDSEDTQIAQQESAARIELLQAQTVKVYAEAGAVDKKILIEQSKAANQRMDTQRQAMKDMGDLHAKQKDQELAKRNGSNGGGMAAQSGDGGS
jgi:hypothetical protein